jgi:hypothetical protein
VNPDKNLACLVFGLNPELGPVSGFQDALKNKFFSAFFLLPVLFKVKFTSEKSHKTVKSMVFLTLFA